MMRVTITEREAFILQYALSFLDGSLDTEAAYLLDKGNTGEPEDVSEEEFATLGAEMRALELKVREL